MIHAYAGDKRIEALTREVKHGDKISLGEHVTITCLFTPCHTSGHMLYYVEDKVNTSNTAVFTGDTLFIGKTLSIDHSFYSSRSQLNILYNY